MWWLCTNRCCISWFLRLKRRCAKVTNTWNFHIRVRNVALIIMKVRRSALKFIFRSFVFPVILKTFSVPFVYLPLYLYWYIYTSDIFKCCSKLKTGIWYHSYIHSFYNSTKLLKNYVSRHVTYTRIKTYKCTQQNCCSGNLVPNINMTLLFICLNLVWKLSQIELRICSVYE